MISLRRHQGKGGGVPREYAQIGHNFFAQHRVVCTRVTNYLQGVSGSVSCASRGGGARTRADSVGAFASEDPWQVLDGVGVHRDGPRVNYFP